LGVEFVVLAGIMLSHLLPANMATDPLGAIFLVWVDVVARVVVAPEELPVGVVTSFLGAPFFLWLMRRKVHAFGGRS
jgi:ABC-type Fe3+-siderophore transport system permease subunit